MRDVGLTVSLKPKLSSHPDVGVEQEISSPKHPKGSLWFVFVWYTEECKFRFLQQSTGTVPALEVASQNALQERKVLCLGET